MKHERTYEEKLLMEGETCKKCNGKGSIKVWNGSIHDPKDPEIIMCPECMGRRRVIYVDNPH